jgi:hypothetical protein
MTLTLVQSATMLLYSRLAKSRLTFALATVLMLFGTAAGLETAPWNRLASPRGAHTGPGRAY